MEKRLWTLKLICDAPTSPSIESPCHQTCTGEGRAVDNDKDDDDDEDDDEDEGKDEDK